MKQIRYTVAALLLTGVALGAWQSVNIKLGTFAPDGTVWHKALQELNARTIKATANRVRFTLYPGGSQGSETVIIRRMRPETAQLHAALLTQPGLEAIDEAFAPFGIPFYLETDAELDYVIQKMTPMIRQRLNAKGFHLLHWGNAGWVQLFSKQPVRTLGDLKKVRLYTTEGYDKTVQWYKSNGFNPVPLSYNDIPAQLKTGVIDAAPAPPYGALALRFHLDAKHMLDVRVAPLVGATVVRTEVWSKLSDADRAEIEKIAADVEKSLNQQVPKLDASSIKEMEAAGLSVTKVDGAALAEFRSAAEKLNATMRGNMVPADIYDLAMKYRSEVRKTK